MFLKIKQCYGHRERLTIAPYKYLHIDGVSIFYNYYKGQLLGLGYKTGGGTLIDYLEPSTQEEFNANTPTSQS